MIKDNNEWKQRKLIIKYVIAFEISQLNLNLNSVKNPIILLLLLDVIKMLRFLIENEHKRACISVYVSLNSCTAAMAVYHFRYANELPLTHFHMRDVNPGSFCAPIHTSFGRNSSFRRSSSDKM